MFYVLLVLIAFVLFTAWDSAGEDRPKWITPKSSTTRSCSPDLLPVAVVHGRFCSDLH